LVAIPVADTASNAPFVTRARRTCNRSLGDTRNGATSIDADTLTLRELPASGLDTIWTRVLTAKVRFLPSQIQRQWCILDGVI